MAAKRIVIVGGVAGGASAAARARRLSEEAEITILERGPYVSFANCGLPYYVGGEIADRQKLLVQTVEGLSRRFRLDIRVRTEVTRIDRAAGHVELRQVDTGETSNLPYDALILATGTTPLRPPIPGIARPGHFGVQTVPDVDRIVEWIERHAARRAVVVGGGYIGLEMAEQLVHRGLSVSLVEAMPQVMTPLDVEMAALIHGELRTHGVDLHLGDGVSAFEPPTTEPPARSEQAATGEQAAAESASSVGRTFLSAASKPATGEQAAASVVALASGKRLPADIVILALGVRPEVSLARDCNLDIGTRGGIRVDARMQTSDPRIWAVGDCVEVRDFVTGASTLVPLAGPANRQGRIAADNILGRKAEYHGTQGTAILRVFGLTIGCTGANEKTLQRMVIPYQAVHVHPGSHAGYYPGAKTMALKILFGRESGKLLGAQAVGADGVDKRIDVLATALRAGMTVDDLAELELAYAPPFGSAKDAINMAGMAAQNVREQLVDLAQWYEVAGLDPAHTRVLDVRSDDERAAGFIPGSIHIPLPELRERLGELPRDREIVAYCQSGQRSYNATRILAQHGFRVRNLTGSYRTWKAATGEA